MHNTITQPHTPWHTTQEIQQAGIQGSYRLQQPQPQPRIQDDFPAQSSFTLTGLRTIALTIVLFVVTISMLGSFLFLFSTTPLHLQLPAMSFSWSSLILASTSGGGGMLLWIVLTSIFKHLPQQRHGQEQTSLQAATHAPLRMTTSLPPEPTDWHDGIWHAPQRERHTEELQTHHMRQRLQTLQWYYTDDIQEDEKQKKHSPLQNRNQKANQHKTTKTLLQEKGNVRQPAF